MFNNPQLEKLKEEIENNKDLKDKLLKDFKKTTRFDKK